MTLNIQIPDNLYNQAIIFANQNNYKIDDMINSQFISYFENYLLKQINDKAALVKREDFEKILSRIPNVEPLDYDSL